MHPILVDIASSIINDEGMNLITEGVWLGAFGPLECGVAVKPATEWASMCGWRAKAIGLGHAWLSRKTTLLSHIVSVRCPLKLLHPSSRHDLMTPGCNNFHVLALVTLHALPLLHYLNLNSRASSFGNNFEFEAKGNENKQTGWIG